MSQRLAAPLLALLLTLFSGGVAAQEKKSERAPEFTLRSIDGRPVTLSSLTGKGPVIISFWATWCIPCISEMKHLKALQEKYGDKGLTTVAISIDDTKTASKVKQFVTVRQYPFVTLLDVTKTVYRLYHVANVPHLFLLDATGAIAYQHSGFVSGDEVALEQKIKGLLSQTLTPES